MSGRPTADIVADLRTKVPMQSVSKWPVADEAADLLAELEAEAAMLRDVAGQPWPLADEWERIDAARPTCPTCGGVQSSPSDHVGNCPDCVDGKVSIEQLAATWRAVWDDIDARRVDSLRSSHDLRRHLRAVKP